MDELRKAAEAQMRRPAPDQPPRKKKSKKGKP
jgi:hypothetical protein